MKLLELRKLDYIIFYVFFSVSYIVQLVTASISSIVAILLICIMPALILGTLTNSIFKKKK